MSKEQFKRISRLRSDTDVFAFPTVCREGGVVTYEDEKELRDFFYQNLNRYLPEEKIYG
jgi:spore photoproduct lyase